MKSFVWSIYCWWVGSLVVLGFVSQPPTEWSAAECYWKELNARVLFEYWTRLAVYRATSWAMFCGNYVRQTGRQLLLFWTRIAFDQSCFFVLRWNWRDVTLQHGMVFKCSFHKKLDEDRAQNWSEHLFYFMQALNVAFPQDGGSCNGFSHLKIIHFHLRMTHTAL